MEFTSNLWQMVVESDRISEEHKEELFSILTDIQDLETELIESGSNLSFICLKKQSRMVALGDKFEKLYLQYGGYSGWLTHCKTLELERKKEELKTMLPKIPGPIKKILKVK